MIFILIYALPMFMYVPSSRSIPFSIYHQLTFNSLVASILDLLDDSIQRMQVMQAMMTQASSNIASSAAAAGSATGSAAAAAASAATAASTTTLVVQGEAYRIASLFAHHGTMVWMYVCHG